MQFSQAKTQIEEAILKKNMCLVVGECYVEYWGRAASKLPKGKRLLLIKGDNSFAIHQNKLLRPTNYMMGVRIACKLQDDFLQVSSKKIKPKEQIEVNFYSIEAVHSHSIQDVADIRLFGSEKELNDELMQDLSFLEPGLKPLNQEQVLRRGLVDILAEDKEKNLVVIELKRRKADYNAVQQLKRYVDQVKNIKSKKTRGILLAPEIGKNSLELLERYNLEFYSFEFEIGNPSSKIKGIQKKQKTIDTFFEK
jgi:RecB family endonuclease NucS